MNKKGIFETGDLFLWLYRFLLVIVVGFFIYFVINYYYGAEIDVRPVEGRILAERVANCFSDEVGVVEFDIFTDEVLGSCVAIEDGGGVKASLKFAGREKEITAGLANHIEPLCEIESDEKPYCKQSKKYVLVNENGGVYGADFIIKIMLKK